MTHPPWANLNRGIAHGRDGAGVFLIPQRETGPLVPQIRVNECKRLIMAVSLRFSRDSLIAGPLFLWARRLRCYRVRYDLPFNERLKKLFPVHQATKDLGASRLTACRQLPRRPAYLEIITTMLRPLSRAKVSSTLTSLPGSTMSRGEGSEVSTTCHQLLPMSGGSSKSRSSQYILNIA